MKPFKAYRPSSSTEIDLRKEMNRFMFGAPDEIAKGGLFILRKMTLDDGIVYPTSEADLSVCSCKGEFENEADIDFRCPVCDGEGYLFTDYVVAAYKTDRFEYQDVEKYQAWGKNTIAMSFFYVEYHETITRYDKLIEPVTDLDGKLVSPVKILQRHNIHMAERFRADNGRTEYWRLSCFSE